MTIPEIISAALLMGTVGSLHCIGMCGPLALALPMDHRSAMGRVAGGALYNLGRITTYALLGFVLGMAGQAFLSGKAQQIFSMGMGALILFYVLAPVRLKVIGGIATFGNKPLLKLRQVLSRLFGANQFSAHYLVGVLNGLLPCGLIYLAITSSFLTGSAVKGSLFMAFFGLGTFPAMLAVVFFGNYMNLQLRLRLRKAVPLFLVLMGALLILRGMNLGIPFISPQLPNLANAAAACH